VSSRQTLIELQNVTARVRSTPILAETSWKIETGCHWAVIGPNGSGKSTLVGILNGRVPVIQGRTTRNCPPDGVHALSFETVDTLMAREERLEEARHFANRLNESTTARDIIAPDPTGENSTDVARAARALDIMHLLDRSFACLSSGEIRKVLLARALVDRPQLLVLDEPYEGLDAAAGESLSRLLPRLIQNGTGIVLVTHQLNRISRHFTHVLCVKTGRVLAQGPRDEILVPEILADLYGPPATDTPVPIEAESRSTTRENQELICLQDTTVAYGDKIVLDRLNWTFRVGEHWAVLGPNGSGKSTLVKLITGDHPQAYANCIRLFGRPRGSGESIWDIKKQIGLISSELQLRYRKGIRVIDVIRSGFFDSVGLYRHCSKQQGSLADQWLETVDLAEKRETPFDQLSYGERRLVLLARAMVKAPRLLVMDEPCQGLDPENRAKMLAIVVQLCGQTGTHLLYITHLPEEIPSVITRVLRLG